MRNSSWKGWFGAEVGFSIYIHRRGFTSTTTNSHQPSLLPLPRRARPTPRRHTPTRPRLRAPRLRALRLRALRLRALRLRAAPAPYALRALRLRALRPRSGPTRPTLARPVPSHQHAGQPHLAGVLHHLVVGSISAPAGRCGVRGPKRSPVARAVASRHDGL